MMPEPEWKEVKLKPEALNFMKELVKKTADSIIADTQKRVCLLNNLKTTLEKSNEIREKMLRKIG